MDSPQGGGRNVSSFRQFMALNKKNWLLKKRKPVSLILELLLPIAFMFLMTVLANSGGSKTVEDEIIETANYPVPSLEFLYGQTVGNNILCYDNNMFNYCSCDYEKPEDSIIDEYIGEYYSAGFDGNSLQALFMSSHSAKALSQACQGLETVINDPATDPTLVCDYYQYFLDLCGYSLDGSGLCPDLTTTTMWTVAAAEVVINATIQALYDVNFGLTIPADAGACSPTKLAIIPMENDWTADQIDLTPEQSAALAFYVEVTAIVGENNLYNFSSNADLDAYVEGDNYSRDASLDLISTAVVFESGSPNWEYTLRSNFTKQFDNQENDSGYRAMGVPSTSSIYSTSNRNAYSTGDFEGRVIYPFNQMYYTSGLLTLQQEIDSFILGQEGVLNPILQYRAAFFPSEKFVQYDFWPNVGSMFAIVMVLVLMYPVSNVIRSIVVDKELKLKEGMLQMGLGAKVYTSSWIFQFVVVFFVLAILLTVIGSGSVFKYSDGGIVFLFFFLFFLSTIALCFLIATFFDKARSASTYGSLIYFVTVFPYFGVSNDGSSTNARLGVCILPSSCFAVGTLPFVDYEGSGIGVTSSTVDKTDSVNISMSQVFGMFILDIFLYSFLAWYASQVVKSDWGTNRPWYFLFTKTYWLPAAVSHDDESLAKEALQADETQQGLHTIENVSDGLRRQISDGSCVALRGLTKTYPSSTKEPFKAVDSLNLTMYQNQITALLGHNGAGKTTTMNMLTGMVPVTSGRAFVNGLNVKTQMSKVREDLGVCPQHDILYPDLTVTEHLTMFAVFKGVPRKRVKVEVENMVKAVGLVEKKNEKSAGLSGGQKRKLSVAIAFIGGSKVVFLDEPTSGMDPHSRRFTWDVIRRQKEGRIVVLTTHFMDEADLLGDRIAIMGHGTLKCCGSSFFLKGLYGVGYNLTVVKTIEGSDLGEQNGKVLDNEKIHARLAGASKEIQRLVQSHVPQAQRLSDVGAEVSFQLPTSASVAFKNLFNDLDNRKESLCIGTYGMSVTTLEEVFIRVANGTEALEDRNELIMLRQKSFSNSMRKFGGIDNESVLPIAASVNEEIGNNKKFTPENYSKSARFTRHLHALVTKRALTYKRDRKMICFTALAPSLFLLVGLLILLIFPNVDQPLLVMTLDDFNKDISAPRNPIPYTPGCDISNAPVAPTCDVDTLVSGYPLDYGVELIDATDATASTVFELNKWLLENKNNYPNEAIFYGAYAWNEIDIVAGGAVVDVTVHSNFTALHAAPTYTNQISNAVLQLATGTDATITISMHPMPRTQYEAGIDEDVLTFPTVLFLMVGFAFIPAAWCGYVVRERETKTKHQQVVSGVSLYAYWASTYAWDIGSFILTPPLIMILLAIFGKSDSIIGGAEAGLACFLLLLLWGPANMGFTYCFSFFFTEHAGSMTSTLFVNWVFGLIAPIAIFFMLLFESVKPTAEILQWILRLHPGFCLGDGLLNLGNRLLVQYVYSLAEEPTPFDSRIAGADLIYMAIEIIIFAVLTILLERTFSGTRTIASYISDMRLSRKMHRLSDPSAFWDSDLIGKGSETEGQTVPLLEDNDVITERDRIQKGVDDVIQIQGLRKAYPVSSGTKVAVRNLWLGIPKGQCFALLGINGAGKTTAISTLCGEQKPTEGVALLTGIDVTKNVEEAHRLVGYCPQFDALFDTMTGREHLQLYARIKGIPESSVNEAVESKIVEMDLSLYADKLAGGYSGGNKRKLSVAVAMLGGPEIVFLDEPSTGVDPVARRHMWEVISRIVTTNKECALVLTTHSMEEAEALCQRIGIMVGGRMQCIGSAQHLKSRFGAGYQLEVTAALPSSKKTTSVAQELLKAVNLSDGADQSLGDLQVKEALRAVFPALEKEICLEGRGSLIYQELHADGKIEINDLAAWAIQESTCSRIAVFVAEHFVGADLVEKQGAKMRLALPPQKDMTLGTVFGLIEDNRANLGIGDYALGQTSLEQIFNGFAAKQAEETSAAPGRGGNLSQDMLLTATPVASMV